MSQRAVTFVLATMAVLALASCSSVSIVKVKDGESLEGIPFYLPRPYVQVFEPFVIGSKAYLVSGKLSPDGNFLLIDNVKDTALLDGLFRSDIGREQALKVPVSLIRRSGTAPPHLDPGGGGAQGLVEAPAEDPEAAASAASIPSDGAGAPAAVSSASAPGESKPVGNFNISVANTTATFPPTLGRRFFDIVWMPDFDEKYVVQGKPGLGNTNIGVTLTQGWGLYGLDAQVDNSALVKPLLDFYSVGFDALGKLAKSKIFPGGDLLGGGAQGAIETADLPPGARVTIKVTRVQVVAPGLYPILKPKEQSDIDQGKGDPSDLVTRHIPLRPYTNIAFNTYQVVVVEAAKPSGDTPMNLQRYFDQTGPEGTLATPSAPAQDRAAEFNAAQFETTINGLLANRKGPGGGFWKLSSLAQEGTNLTGTATFAGEGSKPAKLTTMAELAAFVASRSNSRFFPGNIKLTEAP